jgi:hypothetical protein
MISLATVMSNPVLRAAPFSSGPSPTVISRRNLIHGGDQFTLTPTLRKAAGPPPVVRVDDATPRDGLWRDV